MRTGQTFAGLKCRHVIPDIPILRVGGALVFLLIGLFAILSLHTSGMALAAPIHVHSSHGAAPDHPVAEITDISASTQHTRMACSHAAGCFALLAQPVAESRHPLRQLVTKYLIEQVSPIRSFKKAPDLPPPNTALLSSDFC